MSTDYTGLPIQFRGQMRAYIDDGHRPCAFLQNVLDNDLRAAALRHQTGMETEVEIAVDGWKLFGQVVTWVFSEAPAKCYGSPSKVDQWIRARGLVGLAKVAAEEERQLRRVLNGETPSGVTRAMREMMAVVSGRRA